MVAPVNLITPVFWLKVVLGNVENRAAINELKAVAITPPRMRSQWSGVPAYNPDKLLVAVMSPMDSIAETRKIGIISTIT